MARKIRFRPPGLKPGTRIGNLGPYRGRLGLAWVIAPLAVGVLILAAGWFLLFRRPGPLPPCAGRSPRGAVAPLRARPKSRSRRPLR